MMRRMGWVILLSAVILFAQISAAVTNAIGSQATLYVNGQLLETAQPAELGGGHTLVPAEAVETAFGAEVHWEASTGRITISHPAAELILHVNRTTGYRDGAAEKIGAAPKRIGGQAMLPLRWVAESLGARVDWNARSRSVSLHTQQYVLPAVGSYEHLKTLLMEASSLQQHYEWTAPGLAKDMAPQAAAVAEAGRSAPAADAGAAYSTTNIQVQGVDEADIVKTDGKYIYQVNQGRIVIAEAYPAEELKVIHTVHYNDRHVTPQELYMDDRHLVVIGSRHYPYSYYKEVPIIGGGAAGASGGTAETPPPDLPEEPMPNPVTSAAPSLEVMPRPLPEPHPIPIPAPAPKPLPGPVMPVGSTTIALVYDWSDRTNLRLVREVELEGYYVSSRKIGSSLYLVANKHIDSYRIMNEKDEAPAAPVYRDSGEAEAAFRSLPYEDIYYFPGPVEPNYLLIGGLQLDRPEEALQVSAYLGYSGTVYASQEHLYTTVTRYHYPSMPESGFSMDRRLIMPLPAETTTQIYKFALDNGTVRYAGEGEVPGTVLNSFSMDEHDGYFRIATTTGEMWRNDAFTSRNNLYILDEGMKVTGQIEGIAPGERIYSVRFMGNRGYMVTFRTVDPLFVLDLDNPYAPAILGELKIPGYSDYLHPYDEHHLIGFGMNTIEVEQKDRHGNVIRTDALMQGMKLAVFDVSDVSNPVEKFTEYIGDRGTSSELLYNHKALLFSRERNLLSFPVTVYESRQPLTEENRLWHYGEFVFQGAYVYHIDMETGFNLRGAVTHLTDKEIEEAGRYWYPYDRHVQRALYIGDTLYTLSDSLIKANNLYSLDERGSLRIP